MPVYLFLLLLSLIVFPLKAEESKRIPHVRVALLRNLSKVSIDGKNLLVRDVWTYSSIFQSTEFSGLNLEVNSGTILLNYTDTETNWLTVIPLNGVMNLNNKPFRGKAEIAVDSDGKLVVINELSIEDYLKGVINREISSAWEIDAVMAQAIVARTYALYKKHNRTNRFYDLESTVLDQVYGGADTEDSRVRYAVENTEGLVLTYKDELIKPYYFSTCGGYTEDGSNVWGEEKSYLKSTRCKYCRSSPVYNWTISIPLIKIEKTLNSVGFRVKNINEIKVLSKFSSGRVKNLKIKGNTGEATLSGVDFRKILGYDVIKSTLFDVHIEGDSAVFNGRGAGHGVGLCQWGAKGMAEAGYNYKEILEHYFPGTIIKRWY